MDDAKLEKQLDTIDFNKAMTYADHDLKTQWRKTKRGSSKSSGQLSENEVMTRNLELAMEFSRYLLEHPASAERMPANAQIFFMPDDDLALCEANRRLIEMEKRHRQPAPIVVVRCGKLAPAKSRMIRPRVDRRFVEWMNC